MPAFGRRRIARVKLARSEEHAFSLMRPPGHHATQNHRWALLFQLHRHRRTRSARDRSEARRRIFDSMYITARYRGDSLEQAKRRVRVNPPASVLSGDGHGKRGPQLFQLPCRAAHTTRCLIE